MEESNWYYNDNGKPAGPMTLEELRQQFATGGLHPGTLVWHQTLVQWMPANQIPGVLPPGPPPVPPPPSYATPVMPAVPSSHHTMAVAAFVLSIIGVVIFPCGGFVLGVPAIILAIIALRGMSHSQRREGYGLAVAAIILGALACTCGGGILFNTPWWHHHMYYYYHAYPPRWNQI